jgi:hypothetical protein
VVMSIKMLARKSPCWIERTMRRPGSYSWNEKEAEGKVERLARETRPPVPEAGCADIAIAQTGRRYDSSVAISLWVPLTS